ncbi:hypothetical protein ACHQM5_003535 [Ranunculus cassubicifolius]
MAATTTPFQLGSNDDQLERTRVRAALAASVRRRSLFKPPSNCVSPPDPCFTKQQLTDLLRNCIKLSTENKINQKNTWELSLIDHLSEIIKVEAEDNDAETNFQKASCTLEAGVKIYASRVDSVHSEAYKVLGALMRAGRCDEQEAVLDGDHGREQEEGHSKKEKKMVSPLSTLEPSFESLNVKKFDVAFAVDPLYHQTSSQFDEGGAKGLLLNNLGVYGGCRIVFDSFEVPGRSMLSETQSGSSGQIDLSFAKEYIEQMLINISEKNEISPTLQKLIEIFDEDNQRPSNTYPFDQERVECDDAADEKYAQLGADTFVDGGNWSFHQDDQSVVDEISNFTEPAFPGHHEEYDSYAFQDPEISDYSENAADFLFLSLGFASNRNAWAGPDHWKFRKVKDLEDNPVTKNGPPKKTKNKKHAEPDISFTNSLEKKIQDIFAPAKIPNTLLLPANRIPCNTTLPEDCHYQPENLVKFFLLPNTLFLGKRARKIPSATDESRGSDFEPWDNENAFDAHFDHHSDVEDPITFVSQRRQVNKIEVKYDKTSKQVDVHALKETLWNHIRESAKFSEMGSNAEIGTEVSFRDLLWAFPDDCTAAGAIEDISPHLCFICLLHLTNEHGLRLLGHANLDDLTIQIPSGT